MSSRSTGHGPHLRAAYRALTRALDEIEAVATQGRAPGTSAQPLTPLPPEYWAQLQPRLAHLRATAEEIVRRHAPDALPTSQTLQPLAATLRWTDLLLRRLEESLEDLEPGGITRKFGPFPQAGEAERMVEEAQQMQADLAAAQEMLAIWRSPEKSS